MSDNCPIETYHWDLDFRDDETVEESQPFLDVQHLQHLIARRDHELFLAAFENTAKPGGDFLKALGGEGLCLLLEEVASPSRDWSNRYARLLLDRSIEAPPAVIFRLATLLDSTALTDMAKQEENKRDRTYGHGTARHVGAPASATATSPRFQ